MEACNRFSTSPSRFETWSRPGTFYVDTLGCEAARSRQGYQDVWFYGMQVTLQDRPDEVAEAQSGSVRHFGVALGRDDFDAVVARLGGHGRAVGIPALHR